MQNFYSVLCVAPKASDAEIKSAFRNLAKTCHPDVKPGDSDAEAAFQEVKRAYKFLSNPETRKVYDEFLASRRAVARRRLKRAAATMSASFVLTAASVLLAAVLVQEGGLPFASGRGLAEGPAGSSVQRPGSTAPLAAAEAAERRADAVTEKRSGP